MMAKKLISQRFRLIWMTNNAPMPNAQRRIAKSWERTVSGWSCGRFLGDRGKRNANEWEVAQSPAACLLCFQNVTFLPGAASSVDAVPDAGNRVRTTSHILSIPLRSKRERDQKWRSKSSVRSRSGFLAQVFFRVLQLQKKIQEKLIKDSNFFLLMEFFNNFRK